jgi:hypothetical protein
MRKPSRSLVRQAFQDFPARGTPTSTKAISRYLAALAVALALGGVVLMVNGWSFEAVLTLAAAALLAVAALRIDIRLHPRKRLFGVWPTQRTSDNRLTMV